MAQLLCCCCCLGGGKEKTPLLIPKNEDLQEMEYHFAQVSASESSTPWTSGRQSPASEPPDQGDFTDVLTHEKKELTTDYVLTHEGKELTSGSTPSVLSDYGAVPEGESKKSWRLYPSPGPSQEGASPPPLTVHLRTAN